MFFHFWEDSDRAAESQALLADWLVGEAKICVTAELDNEIARQEDSEVRQQSRRHLSVTRASVSTIWRQHNKDVSIPKKQFSAYFDGCASACAVKLGEYRPLGPFSVKRMSEILSGFRAPQSYIYVGTEGLSKLFADDWRLENENQERQAG